MTHCDSVVDGYGVELGGEAPFGLDELFDVLSYFVQVDVSGNHLRERVGYADYGHSHLLFGHSVCAPQASGSGHAATRCGRGAS